MKISSRDIYKSKENDCWCTYTRTMFLLWIQRKKDWKFYESLTKYSWISLLLLLKISFNDSVRKYYHEDCISHCSHGWCIAGPADQRGSATGAEQHRRPTDRHGPDRGRREDQGTDRCMYIGLYNNWGKKKHNVQRLDACAQSLNEFS